MPGTRLPFFASLICLSLLFAPAQAQDIQLSTPPLVLTGVPFEVAVEADPLPDSLTLLVEGKGGSHAIALAPGQASAADLTVSKGGPVTFELSRNGQVLSAASTRSLPGWLSIVPPLLAILMALAFKRVIPALFLGIWIGAWAAIALTPAGLVQGFFDTFQTYVRNALADGDHASIILFTLMIGGMVGIISKNGGTQGIVNGLVSWARTPKRGQLATWFMGLAIFFDDYANTLVVGKTMRPVTDKLRISREKLAYIVDSTAAPVASLALATTWIGYEVGLIGDAVDQIDGFSESAYSIFLNSLAYSFYPLLALLFVFLVAYMGRDFGPMLRAERRARSTGEVASPSSGAEADAEEGEELSPIPGKPQRAFNAIIPVLVLVGGVLSGLFITGEGDSFQEIIGSSDSYKALMWASLAGAAVAMGLTLFQRILTLEQTVEAWYAGLKSMMFAMIILVLAWSLSEVTSVLHTADYLVSVLGESLNPAIIPALIFFLAAATGFATGSSWGAMGILMPLVIPLTWAVLEVNGMAEAAHYHIIYSTVSCVLAGSVWGDHCSPISDTTILSSMASSCNHIDHVRTQLPYVVVVGSTAILLGTLPAGFGMPWWIGLVAGAGVLVTTLYFFGKQTEEAMVTG